MREKGNSRLTPQKCGLPKEARSQTGRQEENRWAHSRAASKDPLAAGGPHQRLGHGRYRGTLPPYMGPPIPLVDSCCRTIKIETALPAPRRRDSDRGGRQKIGLCGRGPVVGHTAEEGLPSGSFLFPGKEGPTPPALRRGGASGPSSPPSSKGRGSTAAPETAAPGSGR